MHNILYKIKEVGSEARARFEQNSHIREILLRRPELTQLVSEQARAQTQLRPLYEEYVTSVSTADMAVSLPIASLCLALCRIEHPKRILDLGSGFSSFIFRMHATELGGCEVYSADDSAEWLHKTRDYLITKQMPATNLYEWPLPKDTDKFDFIFHDQEDI